MMKEGCCTCIVIAPTLDLEIDFPTPCSVNTADSANHVLLKVLRNQRLFKYITLGKSTSRKRIGCLGIIANLAELT